jgi:hypothetical protein
MHAHHFELADDRQPKRGHRRADAWDNGVNGGHGLALVVELKLAALHQEVKTQRVVNAHFMSARRGGFDQPPRAVQVGTAGQNGDVHRYSDGQILSPASIGQRGCTALRVGLLIDSELAGYAKR